MLRVAASIRHAKVQPLSGRVASHRQCGRQLYAAFSAWPMFLNEVPRNEKAAMGPLSLGALFVASITLLPNDSHSHCSGDRGSHSTFSRQGTDMKFDRFAAGGNKIELERFIDVCQTELQINLSEVELTRVFNRIDTDKSGVITYPEFRRGVRRSFLFKSIANDFGSNIRFQVCGNYDFSVPTYLAYRHADYVVEKDDGTSSSSIHDPVRHGEVYGEFADIRRGLDYSWHSNYSRERQMWQDQVVRRVALCQGPQERPWLIYTCGAMGAGKGHVMEWMSRNGVFPLEDIIHIDPDHFKLVMPEWAGYTTHARLEAGTMCHKESAFLQEIAQEAALRASQHVWVDGSLRDFVWYTQLFAEVRKTHPKYRIALIYVHCSPQELFRRIKKRGRETGRWIPEEKARQSLKDTRVTIGVLSHQVDFVAMIDNEETTPWVETIHDHAHSFSTIKSSLDIANTSFAEFPDCLRALSVERDLLLTEQLILTPTVHKSLTSASDRALVLPLLHACRPWLRATLRNAESVGLLLSPPAKINLDLLSRKIANIPNDASSFVACYGACQLDGRALVDEFEVCEEMESLLSSMSFIYLDDLGNVVAVNILSQDRIANKEHFIRCGTPDIVPRAMVEKLQSAGRWSSRVSLQHAVGRAFAVAWLFPGELKECPLGAFAFCLLDGRYLYFPVVMST